MKMKSYIYSLIASALLVFSACTPDEYDLGNKTYVSEDLVEGIAYTITHDSENPNIVYLESKLDASYVPLWEHPQGRSQEKKVILKIPFEGTYTVKFGVETHAGVVYGEPTSFTVENFCAEFVTDELWTLLTGGVGKSKVWIYDNGEYGYSSGELSYGDPAANPNFGWNSFTAGWEPGKGHCEDGNMWGSMMTFDLIGAANYIFYNSTDDTTQKGLFSMNTEQYTLSITDADLMHPTTWDGRRAEWRRDFNIIELDENHLRIGYKRIPGSWGGEWLEVFNYVSKEYADNYEAPAKEVYPVLADDWRDYVEPKTNKVITYKLSDETPFDWCNFDGSVKEIKNISALTGIEDVTLVLNSGTNDYTFTDINGNEYTGKYTLNADGIYTFSEPLPEFALSVDGRAMFKVNSDCTLRIMSYETSDYTGGLTELWLGSKELDDQGAFYQYMGYHFVVQTADAVKSYKGVLDVFDTNWTHYVSDPVFVTGDGDYTFTINGSCSEPYGIFLDVAKLFKDNPNCDITIKSIKADGTPVQFDDALIDRGTADDDLSTARRYIVNPWGATAGEASKYVFTSSLEVTVFIQFDCGHSALHPEEE